jgi:hypothetical protein
MFGRLFFLGLIPICVVLRPSRFLWFARCLANRNEAMKNEFLVIKHPLYDVELIANVLDLIEDSTSLVIEWYSVVPTGRTTQAWV